MNNSKSIVLAAITITACATYLNSCGKKAEDQLSTIVLQQEWIPFSGFAGEVLAADSGVGTSRQRLVVAPSPNGTVDPLESVRTGRAQFGVVSADRLLEANQKGGSFVAIGAVNSKSPTVFLVHGESNIRSPRDFAGKRVGILVGTGTVNIYRLMMAQVNFPAGKQPTEIEVPFELTTFVNHGYDVRPAFTYDEPVQLDLQGVQYAEIRPEDFGVHFLGTVYFTTDSTIKANPELVQDFVDAVANGWRTALSSPEVAIASLKRRFPEIDSLREISALRKGAEYFSGIEGRVLTVGDSAWQQTGEAMSRLGKLPQNPAQRNQLFERSINTKFVIDFYKRRENKH